MFIGHFAVGLGAKALKPRASLGTLFLAAQLADLLWPTLILLGLEKVRVAPGITRVTPLDFVHYPISHSLLTLLVWGLVLAAFHYRRRSHLPTAAILVAAVASHWLLDYVTHRPDLLLHPYGESFWGLGLWSSMKKTVLVEGALFGGAVLAYAWATKAKDKTGALAFWGLAAFLVLLYGANLLGPPPPSATAVVWSAQALWLVVAWAYWVDRHRGPRGGGAEPALPKGGDD